MQIRSLLPRLSVVSLVAVLLLGGSTIALSQSKKPKPKDRDKNKKEANQTQVQTLETQAEKARVDYVNGLIKVAEGFEEQGLTDRTKETLQSILTAVPEYEPAREKLKALEEAVFDENHLDVEVDVTKGWVSSGVAVVKDKPIRLQAEGSLRIILNETVGPEGLPAADVMTNQMVGIPGGALMGVVHDPRVSLKDANISPFVVGADYEFASKQDGILFFRVNLPANSQSKGKYRVKVSGNYQKIAGGEGN